MSAPVTARSALRDRRFWLHYGQMLLAMLAGMLVLGMPLGMLVPAAAAVEGSALAMATSMTVGMTAWMLWRRHGPAPIAEMALAMYVPFLVLLPPHWAGLLPGDAVSAVGHVLMLPAMLVAMLARPAEYTGAHPAHRRIRSTARSKNVGGR